MDVGLLMAMVNMFCFDDAAAANVRVLLFFPAAAAELLSAELLVLIRTRTWGWGPLSLSLAALALSSLLFLLFSSLTLSCLSPCDAACGGWGCGVGRAGGCRGMRALG